MNEVLNFKDSWIMVQYNWIWFLLAFALGVAVGYKYCLPSKSAN